MNYWPQFRSPLLWDVFAVSTYFTISLLFWFVGLIPDLATLRDRSENRWAQMIYGTLAMGWRGSARHWHRYETHVPAARRAGDAAGALGAHGGQLRLCDRDRARLAHDHLPALLRGGRDLLRLRHGADAGDSDSQAVWPAKISSPTATCRIPRRSCWRPGWIVAYGYGIEAFMGWYSGNRNDSFLLWNRLHGPYAFFYFLLLLCNIGIPQVLWIRKLRTNTVALFFVSMVILVGMWLERFVIVVMSLHRDFLNSSWGMYYPTRWDWMTYIGTIGMFLAAMFLFVRILPMISIFEMRTLLPEAEVKPE